MPFAPILHFSRLEAIAFRWEAIAIRLEAIALRLVTMDVTRMSLSVSSMISQLASGRGADGMNDGLGDPIL